MTQAAKTATQMKIAELLATLDALPTATSKIGHCTTLQKIPKKPRHRSLIARDADISRWLTGESVDHYPYINARRGGEELARWRRTHDFAAVSGLGCRVFNSDNPPSLYGRARRACHCDHTSVWGSAGGAIFILNEVYQQVTDDDGELTAAGLVAMELPIALSPYCGKWDAKPGALPGTRSYLLCDALDAGELTSIIQKLNAASVRAPAWNAVAGVSK